MDGIQSLDRGLAILRLLAEEGRITASLAAKRLGIHQSSASRLLMSLQKAGLVRKPDFHSFAADFGLLAFAGAAMSSFPEVLVCTDTCVRLSKEHNCGAAAATLCHGRLLYLSWISPEHPTSFRIVENSTFPIQESSLGLLLAYRLGREEMIELLAGKLKDKGSSAPRREAVALYEMVDNCVTSHGLLDLKLIGANFFNYAMDFTTSSGRFAYALFSEKSVLERSKAKKLLAEATEESIKGLSRKSRKC